MKIIHTSDWHLGKRLEGKSRLPEQEAALDFLVKTAATQKIDAVIIAGDVFDTVNPPADAESLFYSACLRLSRICPVVAIAGNHDNPDRLSAPDGIAAECGIVLGGSLDYSRVRSPFEGGEGFVRITRGKEKVNLALLPYPSPSRMSALGYETGEKYCDSVRDWLALCARGFTASDCNITVSHLFMAKSARAGDEAEIGTAALLPLEVLPEAHYTALGHVHKPQPVSKSRSVYYSGSLLGYTFDDTGDKFFNLLETSAAGVSVKQIPVEGGKKLITETVRSFEEAEEKLCAYPDAFVRILYDCPVPLSAAKYSALRAHECFASIANVYRAPKSERGSFKIMSDREMFVEFYKQEKGEEPDEEILEIFDKAMRGEEI